MLIRIGNQVLSTSLEGYSEHHQRNGQQKDSLPWSIKETRKRGLLLQDSVKSTTAWLAAGTHDLHYNPVTRKPPLGELA